MDLHRKGYKKKTSHIFPVHKLRNVQTELKGVYYSVGRAACRNFSKGVGTNLGYRHLGGATMTQGGGGGQMPPLKYSPGGCL